MGGGNALCLWVVLGFAIAAPAFAGGDPDAARPIVSENCVACHDVPGYQAKYGRAEVNAPSFQSLADQPGTYTAERIRRLLQQPHYPMAKFILSATDIDNLIAFIQSLRHQ